MSVKLQFEEPAIYLGKTRLSDGIYRLYLPLLTALSHTLLISRSNGGKSHTLAIMALGLAKAAAVRCLNLLWARCEEEGANKVNFTTLAELFELIGVVPNTPPLSLCVFDPHRDLAKRLLEDLTNQIASVRVHRRQIQAAANNTSAPGPDVPNWEDLLEEMITYIDLGDRENVFGLNLLDTAMWESKENCASTLIEIFRRIYPDAWGSRMEDCFRHSVYALYLLNTQRKPEQQFTLLDIVSFITVDHWREGLLEHPVIAEQNPVIAAWWKIQFAYKMSDNFRNEVIKPVLNKLNPLLGSDILSRIFGQSRTTLDFEPLIRKGNVILIDLAASEIETENCALAGAILIGFLLKKARQIADGIGREADRPLVQLMVDEFNVILAAPYADIMGQYRKWGVRATLATQSLTLLDELDRTLRPLVMANAANLMVLQVNADDAEYLRRELVADGTTGSMSAGLNGLSGSLSSPSAGGGGLGPDLYDLVNAERGMCYLKGTFDNIREQVFTVRIAERPFQRNSSQVSESDLAQERTETSARILKRCKQEYTRKADGLSASLNHKQQDYLKLNRLELPDPASSELIGGFVTWQTEIAAGLERALKLAQIELEAERSRRGPTRAKGRNSQSPEKAPDNVNKASNEVPQLTGESNNSSTGMAALEAPEDEEDQVLKQLVENQPPPVSHKAGQVKEGSGLLVQFRHEIPRFAPGYGGIDPVRKQPTPLQRFEENRQLPDGVDYTPAAKVKSQRDKDRNTMQRNAQRKHEAEEASLQGREYARQQLQKPVLLLPAGPPAGLPPDNPS